MKVGLRIDVDTFRGTKTGVPNLCRILSEHGIKATFFFSVGRDNMGRHLWRLVRPRFFLKMMRSKAASLYGWDILFSGTLWPGRLIGKNLGHVMKAAADLGHEIGLHAWDHHQWQARIDKMDIDEIYQSLDKGFKSLCEILGQPPVCSAVPGWKCTDKVLAEKSKFAFKYNSDCRGKKIFYPRVNSQVLSQPQIPVTLPTYDEVIGRNGISDSNYNEYILSLFDHEGLNVLTIHAEVEGIAKMPLFKDFLQKAADKGISFVPLGNFLQDLTSIDTSRMGTGQLAGREGWVSFQI